MLAMVPAPRALLVLLSLAWHGAAYNSSDSYTKYEAESKRPCGFDKRNFTAVSLLPQLNSSWN
jgi:hypothetical protein